MINIMDWNKCEREFIRKVEPDKEKAKSIVETSLKRLDFIKVITPNKNNISFIIENYYEIIKELLVAMLLKKGLKSKNHQCLFSYFYKKHPDYEYETNLILKLSFLRNRLNYYGELIDKSFYDKNKDEFIKIIDLLLRMVKD